MMSALRKFLTLFAVLQIGRGTWGQVPGIKYFMATCGGQNCNSVCGTFGYKCAATGQSFPPSSALPIFESLGISCKTLTGTEYYKFADMPNYVVQAPSDALHWIGVCLGFKNIPSTIDCQTANNTSIRRLCPCYDPSATKPPVSTSPTLATTAQQSTEEVQTSFGTAKRPTTTTTTATSRQTTIVTTTSTTDITETTTGIQHTTEEQSTGDDIDAGLPQQRLGARGEAERTALIVVAVFAAVLVLCLLGVAVMFICNKKQLRGKRGTKHDNENLHLGYLKNNNKNTVPDMMDGLTVETNIDEENSYCEMKSPGHPLNNTRDTKAKSFTGGPRYENTCINEKVTDNILYASITEGTNMAALADNNIPLYDRLV